LAGIVKGQNDRLSLETSHASEFHPIDRKGQAVWIHRILFSFYPVHRVILSKKEFTAPKPLNAYGQQAAPLSISQLPRRRKKIKKKLTPRGI